MWPKVSRTVNEDKMEVEMRFLTKKVGLRIDREKCIGCGICMNVCPKEAISRGPIGAVVRSGGNLEVSLALDIVPEVYDPKKCVYCGTCAALCPTFAIELIEDGEPIKPTDLKIVKEKALPKLKRELVDLEKAGIKMSKYFSGEITHDNEQCSGGCMTCAVVCPTGALAVPKKFKGGWNVNKKTVLDETKCVYCGACLQACPSEGSITLKRKDIEFEGEYNEPYWPTLLEKLKNPTKKTIEDE